MRSRYSGLFALMLAAAAFLHLPAMAEPASSARLQLAQAGSDFESWNAIKDSKKAEDYRAYLDKYPNGDFADLAKLRMKKYAAAPAPVALPEAEPTVTQQPAPEPATTQRAAPEAPAPDSAPTQDLTFEAKNATVYARDGGQVRAAPDPKSALVIKLKTGRQLEATGLSTDGRWWRVEVAGGQVGYMHHSVVSDRSQAPPTHPAAEPAVPTPATMLPVLTPPATTQPVFPATTLPASTRSTLPATTQPASGR